MLSTYHENNKTVFEQQRSEHQNANKNSALYFLECCQILPTKGAILTGPGSMKLARQRVDEWALWLIALNAYQEAKEETVEGYPV